MSELIFALIGLVFPWAVGFVVLKIDPSRILGLLSKLLGYVLKDGDLLDRTENEIGVALIKLGALIIRHSDKTANQREILIAQDIEKLANRIVNRTH